MQSLGLGRVAASLLLSACASEAPARFLNPDPPSTWPPVERSGLELLRDLVALDGTDRRGRRQALAILSRSLEDGAVRVESTGPDLVVAHVRGRSASADPILLFAHVDTWPWDQAAWPEEAGPLSGAVLGAEVGGRGVLGGKGAAAVFATALGRLVEEGSVPDRPIWLAVTADGLDPRARSLERALSAFPELARAALAIGPGGYVLRRTDRPEDRLHLVAVGELGFARLLLTAVGPKAPFILSEAITQLPSALPLPYYGPAAQRYLTDLAAHATWPDSWLLRAGPLAEILYVRTLARTAWARHLVSVDARLELVGEPSSRNIGDDERARARVEAFLPELESPPGLRTRLRARLDPRLHVDILDGEPAVSADRDTEEASLRVLSAFAADAWARILGEPSQARLLLRVGIPTVGYVPVEVDPKHVEARARPRERVPLDGLQAAFRELPKGLLRLAAENGQEGATTSTLAIGSSAWQSL